MSILDYKANYPRGTLKWGNGPGRIDCSHLVNEMLRSAGYDIRYQTTRELANSKYFEVVSADDVRPGDLILWNGHVGVVESYNVKSGEGTFFGSQSSTGPASASFGGSAYWKEPQKFLRPLDQYQTIDPRQLGGGNRSEQSLQRSASGGIRSRAHFASGSCAPFGSR